MTTDDEHVRARLNTCWLALCIVASAAATLCAADDDPAAVVLARFAIIYPAADPAVDEKRLSPGAVWLRLPKPPSRKSNAPASGKNGEAAPKRESDTRIAPLRRERPNRETDPPKTRRRKLGW